MSSRFDLCLLLYVIRLVGWLKHCGISFSFTFRTWQNASARSTIYIALVDEQLTTDLMRSLMRQHVIAEQYRN